MKPGQPDSDPIRYTLAVALEKAVGALGLASALVDSLEVTEALAGARAALEAYESRPSP